MHRPRLTHEMLVAGRHYPQMNGKQVFRWATAKMPEVAREVLARSRVTVADIDLFVPHQANMRINQFVARRARLPEDKVVHNIERYGNTTAATIPIGLEEGAAARGVAKGDSVALAAFGAGFTWGAALLRW